MALLRGNWERVYYRNPDIYPIGCVGEIVSVTPLPDGRYNIVLYGNREYEIQEHIVDKTPYRQAKVLLREELTGLERILPAPIKRDILDLVQRATEKKEPDLVEILRDPSLDVETWLNLCCFSLDISILEKQSLLEAKSLEERGTYLLNVLHFKAVEKGTPFEGLWESKEGKPPH